MPPCPLCGSDMVYLLLNTLRCKRCKHIWKVGEEEYSTSRCPDLVPSLRVRKKTDPLLCMIVSLAGCNDELPDI